MAQTMHFKNTFGSSFTDAEKLGYNNNTKFKVTKEISWEDFLKEQDKFFFGRWQEATFPMTDKIERKLCTSTC